MTLQRYTRAGLSAFMFVAITSTPIPVVAQGELHDVENRLVMLVDHEGWSAEGERGVRFRRIVNFVHLLAPQAGRRIIFFTHDASLKRNDVRPQEHGLDVDDASRDLTADPRVIAHAQHGPVMTLESRGSGRSFRGLRPYMVRIELDEIDEMWSRDPLGRDLQNACWLADDKVCELHVIATGRPIEPADVAHARKLLAISRTSFRGIDSAETGSIGDLHFIRGSALVGAVSSTAVWIVVARDVLPRDVRLTSEKVVFDDGLAQFSFGVEVEDDSFLGAASILQEAGIETVIWVNGVQQPAPPAEVVESVWTVRIPVRTNALQAIEIGLAKDGDVLASSMLLLTGRVRRGAETCVRTHGTPGIGGMQLRFESHRACVRPSVLGFTQTRLSPSAQNVAVDVTVERGWLWPFLVAPLLALSVFALERLRRVRGKLRTPSEFWVAVVSEERADQDDGYRTVNMETRVSSRAHVTQNETHEITHGDHMFFLRAVPGGVEVDTHDHESIAVVSPATTGSGTVPLVVQIDSWVQLSSGWIWIGSHEVPVAPPVRRASADAYRAEYSHADFEGVPIKGTIIWLSAGLAVALVAPVPFTVTHGAYVFCSALVVLAFAGVRWFMLRRRV